MDEPIPFGIWLADIKSKNMNMRVGQCFCNQFIRRPWPALYYEEDEAKAKAMIETYLQQLQYWPNMPPLLALPSTRRQMPRKISLGPDGRTS